MRKDKWAADRGSFVSGENADVCVVANHETERANKSEQKSGVRHPDGGHLKKSGVRYEEHLACVLNGEVGAAPTTGSWTNTGPLVKQCFVKTFVFIMSNVQIRRNVLSFSNFIILDVFNSPPLECFFYFFYSNPWP